MIRDKSIASLCLLLTCVSTLGIILVLANVRLQEENYSLKQEKVELLKKNDAQNAEITRLRAHILGLGG